MGKNKPRREATSIVVAYEDLGSLGWQATTRTELGAEVYTNRRYLGYWVYLFSERKLILITNDIVLTGEL